MMGEGCFSQAEKQQPTDLKLHRTVLKSTTLKWPNHNQTLFVFELENCCSVMLTMQPQHEDLCKEAREKM